MQKEKTLVLVDGSSLAFRSFFALFTSGLRTKAGVPTWAILGFFNSLFELIEKFKPDMLAVSFDMSAPTFRHIEFKDYKANRKEMPDDLSVQWPLIKEGVEKLHLPVHELSGYEADDLIGTVAKAGKEAGLNVLILTGDQDAFQLIDDQNIKVLMPSKQGLQLFGRQEVYDKLGIWPEQVPDYKGLCGDSSDNIPGVKGIGPKTAQQLLATYNNIENIYEHINEVAANGVRSKLIEGKELALQSKKLATIDENVPLNIDFDHCHLTIPDVTAVSTFFSDLEFKTLVARLPRVLKNFSSNDFDESTLLQPNTVAAPIEPLPEPIKPESDSTIINSAAELDKLVETLNHQSVISLYVQTSSEEQIILGYAFAWTEKNLVKSAYIPIKQLRITLTNQTGLERKFVSEKLIKIFSNNEITKIIYDSKNTINRLSQENLTLENIGLDPLLASYIFSPDQKHDLYEQAERLLNFPLKHKPSVIKTKKTNKAADSAMLAGINVVEMAAEACEAARLGLALAETYNNNMTEDQKFLLQEMDLPLSLVLAKMAQTGVSLDLPFLKQLGQQLDKDLKQFEQKIYEFAGYPFNINSTQQLQKVLFDELKLATKTKTKTGFSTDASVLESLKGEHAIIPLLLDYRQFTKLKSTYVDALPKMVSTIDDRLHGDFNQTVTSTGRLSSSNPNLQNIPIRTELGRSIRKAFIPAKKDWFLLSADYSQIELRLLAHMSDDERLIDAFKKDQDIHARTAGEIFDQPIETITTDLRRIGKTLNFALIYQQGAYSTAKDLGVSTKEAAAFIDKYFQRYAKVKTFMEDTIEKARQNGYVETLWKRRRYFKFLHDRNEALKRADERAACNAPLQGSAADLMKLAMISLDNQLNKHKFQAKLILQVHDELVLEVPETELEQLKTIVVEAMLLDQPFKVPLKVDVGIGSNWMALK